MNKVLQALYHDGMSRMILMRGGVLGIFLLLAFVLWIPVWGNSATNAPLTVRFLDVGQGDAIHIATPDGYELLIDGGPSAIVLRELAKGRSFFDRTIDVVLATHPDTDHVAGLVDLLKRYEVSTVVSTNVQHTAPAAVAFDEVVEEEGAQHVSGVAGQRIQLGASTTVLLLSPYGNVTEWENNVASIVVQIIYGDTAFMLTGDAPIGIEEYLVDRYGGALRSDVLKLGHHGSRTSSSERFITAVTPAYAVVSAGKDNRYGHPHQEVVARAGAAGARLVSTAEEGTLTFHSDGSAVWLVE